MSTDKFSLTIHLDRDSIPLRFYTATAKDLRSLLDSISYARADEHQAEWQIETDNLTISASANGVSARDLQDITNDIYDGFAAVESDEPDAPPSIGQDGRLAIKRIIKRIYRTAPATIAAPGRTPLPLAEGMLNVNRPKKRILVATSYVDGKLDVISVRRVPYFILYEHGTDNRVRCSFPDDWIDRVKDHLRSRVIVEGRVYYKEDGRATSLTDPIDIHKVPAPKQADLTAYRGAMPDLGGDVSSYALVRALREEED